MNYDEITACKQELMSEESQLPDSGIFELSLPSLVYKYFLKDVLEPEQKPLGHLIHHMTKQITTHNNEKIYHHV